MKLRRLLSFVLTIAMVMAFLPVGALATGKEPTPSLTINYGAETLTINANGGSVDNGSGHFFLNGTPFDSGASISHLIPSTGYTPISVVQADNMMVNENSDGASENIPARPPVPSVGKEDCQVGNDGKIIGFNTATMQWRIVSPMTSGWSSDDSTLDSLAAGTYEVRVTATDDAFASVPASLTINAAGYTITNNITNTTITPLTATHGVTYNGTLSADSGFSRPASITMTRDGGPFTQFSYSATTGAISITASQVTGNFVISGTAPAGYTVTTNIASTSITPSTATHNTAYSGTLNANTGFSRPASITMTRGGSNFTNFTYNASTGAINIVAAQVTGALVISSPAYTVTTNIANASLTVTSATHNTAYNGRLNVSSGSRPATITMTRGGTAFTGFTYNASNGDITITAQQVTGNLVISASDQAVTNVKDRLTWYNNAANDQNHQTRNWGIIAQNNSTTNPGLTARVEVTGNLLLPTEMRANVGTNGTRVFISWIVSPTGNVTISGSGLGNVTNNTTSHVDVTLTARFALTNGGTVLDTKEFSLRIMPTNDQAVADAIYNWIAWSVIRGNNDLQNSVTNNGNTTSRRYEITSNLQLPSSVPANNRWLNANGGGNSSQSGSFNLDTHEFRIEWEPVDWQSNRHGAAISDTGIVTFPTGNNNVTVTLAARVRKGTGNNTVTLPYTGSNPAPIGSNNERRKPFFLTVMQPSQEQLAVNAAINWLTWNQIRNHNEASSSASGPFLTMGDLSLPTSYVYSPTNNAADDRTVQIRWQHSTNTSIVNTSGRVAFPSGSNPSSTPTQVTLTAVFTHGSISSTAHENNPNSKQFTLNVRPPNNAEAVRMAREWLVWDVIRNNNTLQTAVSGNLTLPTTGEYGTSVSWSSSNTNAVSNTGAVTIPTQGGVSVTLTATISRHTTGTGQGGSASEPRGFALTVAAGSTVSYSRDNFAAATLNGTRGIEITPNTGRIVLDAAAAARMLIPSGGGDITFSMDNISSTTLNAASQAAVGAWSLYRLTARVGTQNITSFGGGTVTVEIPYSIAWNESPQSVIVYGLNESTGGMSVVRSYYNTAAGRVRFATTSFSVYVIGHATPPTFSDADIINAHVNQEMRGHITFAATRGLFEGKTVGGQTLKRFDHNGNITNAEFLAVLSRLANSGVRDGTDGQSWFQPYLDWASSYGIFGSGQGLHNISPDGFLTRDNMALWLYNCLVRSNMRIDRVRSWAFSDIAHLSQEYRTAVLTLAEAGVINGTDGVSGGRLEPDALSERVQVAAIIGRAVSAFDMEIR